MTTCVTIHHRIVVSSVTIHHRTVISSSGLEKFLYKTPVLSNSVSESFVTVMMPIYNYSHKILFHPQMEETVAGLQVV